MHVPAYQNSSPLCDMQQAHMLQETRKPTQSISTKIFLKILKANL